MTLLAVQGLQHDLLHNRGEGRDGRAPVRLVDYARGRVDGPTGVVDQRLALLHRHAPDAIASP